MSDPTTGRSTKRRTLRFAALAAAAAATTALIVRRRRNRAGADDAAADDAGVDGAEVSPRSSRPQSEELPTTDRGPAPFDPAHAPGHKHLGPPPTMTEPKLVDRASRHWSEVRGRTAGRTP
jgi:hypothetical protein